MYSVLTIYQNFYNTTED